MSYQIQPQPSEISCSWYADNPDRSFEIADKVAKQLDPDEIAPRDDLADEADSEIAAACEAADGDYRPVNRKLRRRVIKKFPRLQR